MRRRRLVKSKSGCCRLEQAFIGSQTAEWLRCRCHCVATWRQHPTLLHRLPPDQRPASSLRRHRVASPLMFYADVQHFGSLLFGVLGNGNSVANARRQPATFATRASRKHVSRSWRVLCFLLVIRKLLNVATTVGHKPTATQRHMTPRQQYRNNGKLTSLPFQWRQTDRRAENTQSDQQLGSKVRAVPLLGGST